MTIVRALFGFTYKDYSRTLTPTQRLRAKTEKYEKLNKELMDEMNIIDRTKVEKFTATDFVRADIDKALTPGGDTGSIVNAINEAVSHQPGSLVVTEITL